MGNPAGTIGCRLSYIVIAIHKACAAGEKEWLTVGSRATCEKEAPRFGL